MNTIVGFLKHAAQGLEETKQVLYLLGPVGGGKSSLAEKLKELIGKSKFILWNGPLGKYESGFGGATEEVLKIISKSSAHSVIGGGDTVAIVSKLKLENKLGFVSTGGGATLDFLAKGTLPGIKVLK